MRGFLYVRIKMDWVDKTNLWLLKSDSAHAFENAVQFRAETFSAVQCNKDHRHVFIAENFGSGSPMFGPSGRRKSLNLFARHEQSVDAGVARDKNPRRRDAFS